MVRNIVVLTTNGNKEWMEMRMIISGRHLEITEGIRSHAVKKIGRIKKYFDQLVEVDVTLSAEHLKTGKSHTADVLVYANGKKIKAKSTDVDLYAAIDEVVDVLETQLTKHKEKLRDNRHAGALKKFRYDAEKKEVIKEKVKKVINSQLAPKPMSLEEAILQMEVLERDFYTFMNQETEELNVVYRRRDGDYGHVEPGWEK